jgi:tetratricopeptide (TPR) repeat protein
MAASERVALGTVGALVACVLVCAALVQFASYALYAQQAGPQSLAAHVPPTFGLAVYGALDRVAPFGFVEDGLAHAALARGDLDAAQRYALRMPAGGRRDDVLADVARARGNAPLALQYAISANDVDALQSDIMTLARHDVHAASALEARVRGRLAALGTHPDAVAESYYISGNLANWRSQPREASADYQAAIAIAPLNVKYVLSEANEAYILHDDAGARRLFRHVLDLNPASGDALSGLGLVALRAGHRGQAVAYLARARAVDPHAEMIPSLAKALR